MKKAISFALCFMLIFSLAVPSFAAGLAPKIDSIAVASERTATIINGPVRLRSSAQINNTNTLCQLNTGTEVVVKNENCAFADNCNGVQREHNKKLNNGLPILHKVPPKRDYGRYFCIMAEKGGTSHGGLTEKLSPFFYAQKQEVNAYGR